ncbi:MAG: methionyl-tRNA formyltransferase [Rhodothermales bacterium]
MSDRQTSAPRIVFMGTAAFAVPSLEALCAAGFTPIAVATGADKPRGRGQHVTFTPVKEAAVRLGIDTLLQPEHVKDPAFAQAVAALHPDIVVVVAYRILPPAVYTAARLGAFNLHGSLLPRYRGAAPIHRAVMAGETETGVTTFFLAEQVDTGNLILQRSMPIGPDETTGEVHDRMMMLGAEAVVETVRRIVAGTATPLPQNNEEATAAPKLFKEDGVIDWGRPAKAVHDFIRGLSPFPGAWTRHGDTMLKIYRSTIVDGAGAPGEVLEAGKRLVVACGEGAVALLEVQQEGRRRLPADVFVNGYALKAGDRLTP